MAGPLTLSIGIAISKAVFKGWFKDSELVSSLTDSLHDLVASAVPGWQASSAAERQLQRMGEKAATALEPLLKIEWSNLPSGEKQTAVFQVQLAIDNSNVNSRLLAELDFDPNLLRATILSNLVTTMLNCSAAELARRLCDESAQLITDLASTMPTFHRDTFAEILQRETAISDSMDRVFMELKQIREQSAAQSTRFGSAQFEEGYRRAAARRLDRIELFGLNTSSNPSSRHHNLSTAYISLTVSGSPAANDNEGNKVSSRRDTGQSLIAIRAEQAASLSPRLVIKGEAGSGKTTLLQSLAVRSATAAFTDEMDEWNSLVPFFIALRELPDSALPQPEDFPALIAPSIAGIMPTGWVHEQLASGRGLVLIDGLDEISEDRRSDTRRWIEDLLATYPDCRLLVTSRPPAIPDGWLSQQGFVELELLPMSPSDVASFVDHWHEAVAGEEQDQKVASDTRELSSKLKERIRTDRSLRELAATPLLCAMLCAMNRDRREVLPSNRIALYEAAVQLILHGRDEQRKVRISDLPSLEFEIKRDLLQEIAFWMMENGLSMAEEWRVVDLISNLLPRFPKLRDTFSAELIVKALIHRSGVLRSPVDGKCDFIHNAFKEYLCARAISQGDRFGFLQQAVATDETWREVAPMAAAITDDRRRTGFLTELLNRGDSSQSKRVMYHLLAVRCLETCTQLEPDMQDRIREKIKGLRPPNSVSEAKSLSAAGDLALPLVRKTLGQYARTSANCVRTLRLIGTPGALEAMESYGSDGRSTVVKELLSAWPFFNRREYAHRVLANTRGLWNGLRVDSIEAIDGIGALKALARLEISLPRDTLTDEYSNELSGLNSLTTLTARVAGAFTILPLLKLSKLQVISLSTASVPDVSLISKITSLRSVTISCRDAINFDNADILKLTGFTLHAASIEGLRGVDINDRMVTFSVSSPNIVGELPCGSHASRLVSLGIPAASFFGFVETLPNPQILNALRLSNSANFPDLSFCSVISNVKSLTMTGCRDLISLNGIENMKDLKELSLYSAHQLSSLRGLEGCEGLERLTLGGPIDLVEVEPILALTNLRLIYGPAELLRRLRAAGLHVPMRAMAVVGSART